MSLIRMTASGPPKGRRSSYAGETVHGWRVSRDLEGRRGRHGTVRMWECFCVECGARGEKSTADLCKLADNQRRGRGLGGCAGCRQRRSRVPDSERICARCGCRTFSVLGDSARKCSSCMTALARERAVGGSGEKGAAL